MSVSPNRTFVAFAGGHAAVTIAPVPPYKCLPQSDSSSPPEGPAPQHPKYSEHLALAVLKNTDPNDVYRAVWTQDGVTADSADHVILRVTKILAPTTIKAPSGGQSSHGLEPGSMPLALGIEWQALRLTLGLMRYGSSLDTPHLPSWI